MMDEDVIFNEIEKKMKLKIHSRNGNQVWLQKKQFINDELVVLNKVCKKYGVEYNISAEDGYVRIYFTGCGFY